MTHYKITYSFRGKKNEVIIKANSLKEASALFRKKYKGVIRNVEEIEVKSLGKQLEEIFERKKINLEEFTGIISQMQVMVNAGMSVDIILENAYKNTKDPKLKKIFERIYKDVVGGQSLYNAFERYSEHFGPIVLAMIRLGEETGDLAGALKDLVVILEEILDNRRRLKKATRYPIVILFAMSIAFTVVILFVIPPFKTIFAQLHTELPLPTRFLLWIEAALRDYGILMLGLGIVVFGILNFFYKKNDDIRLKFDKMMLKIYIVGDVIYLAMVGRFLYVFQKLIDSGIPINDAIDVALNIVDNSYIKMKLLEIKNSIQTGSSITQGFVESQMFEPMIIQMISAGEEAGALVEMLKKVSDYYLQKYRDYVDNISALIEPLLIAAIAGFVATLALGIFLPMWNLIDAAG